MTKAQLIRTLEPFADDIEIQILNDKNYKYEPRLFYCLDDGSGCLLLVTQFEPLGPATELRIRG